MKPPKWHRDEIILALDLYYNIEPKEMDHRNPKVIELSETLNKLPIHKDRKDNQKFRWVGHQWKTICHIPIAIKFNTAWEV